MLFVRQLKKCGAPQRNMGNVKRIPSLLLCPAQEFGFALWRGRAPQVHHIPGHWN